MITFFAGIFVAFGDIRSSYTANLRLLLHSKSARFDILYIARLRQVLSGIESGLFRWVVWEPAASAIR